LTAVGATLVLILTGSAKADVITDWNQTAIGVMKVASIAGNPWSRTMAMMHVAMSDAVNSVQHKYAVYLTGGTPMPSASAEAAAAAAARTVLLQQMPAQNALIERAYEASLKDTRAMCRTTQSHESSGAAPDTCPCGIGNQTDHAIGA